MEMLIGLVLPPVIDYFNKSVINDAEKVWVTVIICLLVAGIIDHDAIAHGTFTDVQNVFKLALLLIGEAMTVYGLYWKNSKVRVWLPGNGVSAK